MKNKLKGEVEMLTLENTILQNVPLCQRFYWQVIYLATGKALNECSKLYKMHHASLSSQKVTELLY